MSVLAPGELIITRQARWIVTLELLESSVGLFAMFAMLSVSDWNNIHNKNNDKKKITMVRLLIMTILILLGSEGHPH